MKNRNAPNIKKFDPGQDCTLRHAKSATDAIIDVLNSGSGIEIDCAAIEQADITFVQTIVSAQRSFAARDLPFLVSRMSEPARSTFLRAGVTPPGASPSELSGN